MSAPLLEFARPEWLVALCLVPLVAAFEIVARRRAVANLVAFSGVRGASVARAASAWMLPTVAVLLLVVAAAGPLVGDAESEDSEPQQDLVIALDASRSMWVEDVGKSRLDRAREEIEALVARPEFSRVGLVAFAGAARVACPLTRDRAGFRSLLHDVSPALETTGGTAIGAGIARALSMLAQSGVGTVLVVSDGENSKDAAGLEAAIADARNRRIRVHSIVIGTKVGGAVPVGDQDGDGFVVDALGRPVISRAEAGLLARLSRTTFATCVEIDGPSAPSGWNARESGPLATAGGDPSRGTPFRGRAPVDRFRILAILALLLLTAERLSRPSSEAQPRRRSRAAPLALAGVAIVCVGAVPPGEQWLAALRLHRANDSAAAIPLYRQAALSTTGTARDRIEFDLAAALYESGGRGNAEDLAAAVSAFDRLSKEATDPTVLRASNYGAGITLAKAAEAAKGTPKETELLAAARQHFLLAVGALGDSLDDAQSVRAARDLELVTRRWLESKDHGGPGGSEPQADPADTQGQDEHDPSRSSKHAGQAPPRSEANPGGKPPSPNGDGTDAPGNESSGGDPNASAAKLGGTIEEIVREYERRRLAFDKKRAARSRAAEAQDW